MPTVAARASTPPPNADLSKADMNTAVRSFDSRSAPMAAVDAPAAHTDSGTAAPKAAVPRRFVPAGVPAGKGRAMEKPRTGVLAAEPSPPATPPTLLSRLSVRPLQGLSKVSEHADGRPPPKGGRPSTDVLRSGVT
ncbi:hypothetical protein GCM10022233_48210 [Streptomyces shaanxiensis]|uniref:Uncharacterized protein n=1 Tax=Streptomyces shaanxiensis TaxID=653357 RepID=A0ABP7VHY4_9ACTN